jgi:hypothetical protein
MRNIFLRICLLILISGFLQIQSVDAACVTPPSGLVSWWGGDNNALDIVGTNNGSLQGGAAYSAGKVGQAFRLDGGVNSWIETSGDFGNFGSNPFTIAFWMYSNNNGTGGTYIMGKSQPDIGAGWDIRLRDSSLLLVGVNEWPSDYNWQSDASLTPNAWHHVAISATETGVTVYIDGINKGTTPRSSISSTGNPFRIGYTTAFGGVPFNGLLDEVEIFNRALTAGEVAAIYSASSEGMCRPCTAPPSGLVSWWGGNGNALDLSGANNGMLAGNAVYGAGMVGQAFALGGSGYVSIPDAPSLRFNTAMTAEAWFLMDNETATYGVIVGKGDESWRLQRNHVDNNTLLFGTNPGFDNLTGTRNVNDGKWHHAAAVFDGATKYLYVDGVLDASKPWANVIDQTTDPVWIGSNSDYPGRLWKGSIDEVAVYNRALSGNEIAAIYNAGSSGKCFTPDTIPDAFSFTAQTGMPLNTTIVSNPITVAGINYLTPISIAACADASCEYKINSGTWTSSPGNVSNGDTVWVHQKSSSSNSTMTTARLTIGGVNGDFNVTTASSTDPDATGLVYWWKGENNAYDSVGGNNGTLFGTTFGTGKIGQAFSFDGVDDYMSDPNNPPPGSLAISAWIKSSDNSGQNRLIIGENVGIQGTGWQFFIQEGGRLVFGIYAPGWTFVTSSVDLPVNQWVHVAVTFNSANGAMQLYINGVPDSTNQYTGSLWAANTNPLKIGSLGTPTGAAPFAGLIDEIKIYSRALSASEIAKSYGLVAWWKGDNDAFDSIGGNNGVWNGTPAYASGKIGQAFSFDGVDDTVSVGMLNNTALNEALPFSIAAWINTSDTSPYQTIASNYMGESGGLGNYSTYLIINSGNLVFGLNKRQQVDESISTGISTGWHFVTATYDGSVLNLYLDGVLQESAVRQFTGSSDNTRGWYIGNYPPEWVSYIGTNTSFHGLIDDVKIYSRALSAAEVANNYGLVSWWRAENDALDSIGGNHVVLQGGVSFAEGHDGHAFSFNGSQYAQNTAPVNMPVGDAPRSVSLWLKTPLDLSLGTEAGIFQYGTASNGHMFGLVVSNHAPGKLYFYGHAADLNGTTTMLPNNWYHAVVTYDGATVTLYLNGKLEASAAISLNTILDGNGLTIGHQIGKASTWLGEIDEVKVFNRALSAMEVSELAGTYPDAFSFPSKSGIALDAPTESDAIPVTGISQPAPISISAGAQYAVSTNGGSSWGLCTSASGTVNVNNQVKVCLTASSGYSTTTTATLNIGGREGTFSVTTIPDTEKPVVTGFALDSGESIDINIGVPIFTATDNDTVNGYMITTSYTPPLASDTGWDASAPASFSLTTAGINTLYAWAKDPAGNVSDPLMATVTLKPVRRDPAPYNYYDLISAACSAASGGETIKALAVTVPGNVTISDKILTIKGGHADGYGSQNGITTIGSLTVGTGSLIVDRVSVK